MQARPFYPGLCDIERVGALVTDDVVVMHGNRRCVCGKEELKADFPEKLRSIRGGTGCLIPRSSRPWSMGL
jgi:hypothetical protein